MAKPPYRPYDGTLGPRTYSIHETDEERDRREFTWEWQDRRTTYVEDATRELVRSKYNGDWKAAREELKSKTEEIYDRAGEQARLDMEDDRIVLDAKYPPELAAEREAARQKERERQRLKEENREGPPRKRWLERIQQSIEGSNDGEAADQSKPKTPDEENL